MTQKQTSQKNNYDVIIVGGGLAGLSLAVLLGRAGITIGVIERTPLTTQTMRNFDARTTAISAGSAKILTHAGIWEHVEKNACPINKIEILDGPHLHGTWPVLLNFDTQSVSSRHRPESHNNSERDPGLRRDDSEPFGYIVDNIDLRKAQAHTVNNTKNITMITPATVADITITNRHAAVTLNNGTIIRTGIVIGADGRGSIVRDLAGIRTRGWPYPHTAIVSTITHTGAHNNIAVEHFLSTGPFAVLPFTNDENGTPRSAIVWSEHPHTARKIMRMNDDTFKMALMSRLPGRYGDVVHVGPRGAYPLSLQHAVDYTAPRIALVADAAHGMHPIAGQGLNLGLRDVQVLADLMITAASSPRRRGSGKESMPDPRLRGDDAGYDFGTPEILDAYARARKPDILALMSGTDMLTGIFGSRIPGLRPLRKIGMRVIEHLPPVKNFFIRVAKGG